MCSISLGERYDFSFQSKLRHIHHRIRGCAHWADQDEGVFSAFVIPRDKMLQSVNLNNTSNVVRALERLQATEKSCNRSSNKKGTSTSRLNILFLDTTFIEVELDLLMIVYPY